MSIATRRGDSGKTDLVGRIRVSKGELRVECYGTVDELKAQLGFARSICEDRKVHDLIKEIQRDLFKIGSAIATPPESKVPPAEITAEMVSALDSHVRRIEAMDGIVGDWSLTGDLSDVSALDVCRTVCRRAERCAVRLTETGSLQNPNILAYLNRLSDLLWLLCRLIEARAGVDSKLRAKDKPAKRWSRAW